MNPPLPPADIERVLRDEIATQESIVRRMTLEAGVMQDQIKHWRGLCEWAYRTTSEALMLPPQRPRAAREARDRALCEINKRLGGVL